MRIAVAQIGARHHYAVPVALHRANILQELHCDLCANDGLLNLARMALPKRLQRGGLKRLLGRVVPHVPASRIRTYPAFALRHSAAGRQVKSSADQYGHYLRGNQAFGRNVARRGFGDADTVYAFNAAALEIFQEARRRGLRTVLDQVMAPWAFVESILAEERQRWPDWGEREASDGAWKPLAEREAAEWEMADVIIGASEFVARGVDEISGLGDRCRILPYGYDAASVRVPEFRDKGPLRVLFLGTLELRKGVPYLLEAAERLSSSEIEIRAVGPVRVGEQATRKLRRVMDVPGPVPWSTVPEQFAWADVLVLPTVAEGSALVCYEAQAHELPVITTPNCGSVVRDGVDGWIVPIRDSEMLAERLDVLAADRNLLREMSIQARERAMEFTWDHYHARLPKILQKALNSSREECDPASGQVACR